MSVDWTKYPPLPEPPVLPSWRDTPEREAYWEELTDFEPLPRFGYAAYVAALIAVLAGGYLAWGTAYHSLGNGLCAAGSVILIVLLSAIFFRRIYWRIRLWKKYGFFLWKLRRPDLSNTVAAIMSVRPDLDETEFRKYWPSTELADTALEIRQWVRETWELPDKMLYPNDPLILLYERKRIGDDEDYEDHFLELGVLLDEIYDYDLTFAELAETTLFSKKMSEKLREKN